MAAIEGASVLDSLTTAKTSDTWGPVILTICNSVLSQDKLSLTPSSRDGMSQQIEEDLRNLGCNIIQTAGKLLRLPQVAMATACVLFQRFFFAKSFVRYSMEVVAMACVCLSSKIEEAHPPRRIRDVINVFAHIKQVRQGKLIKPVILDENYISLKNNVIKEERRVLKELGFCVHIKHPHKLVVMYMKFLEAEENSKFLQMSWNFMNDSLRTDCFVRYQPETIACACIYLSARKLNIPLPTRPCSWYGVLGVDHEDIIDCCHRIVNLYRRSKPVQEHLEKEVETLKAQLEKSRRMAEVVAKELITDSTVAKLNPEVRQQEKKEDSGKKVQDNEGRSRSREGRRNVYSRDQSYSDRESRKKVSREYSRSPRPSKSRERQEYRERIPEGSERKRNLGDKGEKNQEELRNYKEKYEKGDRIEREKYRR